MFNTPNDNITDKYFEVVVYYEKLSASIQLGLGNLEVIEPEPIKHTPLLTKLINCGYHTAQRQSCKNIATSIKLFSSNLPSFKQYKNQNELDRVIQHYRFLTLELLIYTLNQHSSVATLKSKFNGITRIIRLSYKANHQIYMRRFPE
jgi:hypothetical protein